MKANGLAAAAESECRVAHRRDEKKVNELVDRVLHIWSQGASSGGKIDSHQTQVDHLQSRRG
eukprot:SAG11_NODE_487_length_8999_cov_16.256966_8_plen_62_part_00